MEKSDLFKEIKNYIKNWFNNIIKNYNNKLKFKIIRDDQEAYIANIECNRCISELLVCIPDGMAPYRYVSFTIFDMRVDNVNNSLIYWYYDSEYSSVTEIIDKISQGLNLMIQYKKYFKKNKIIETYLFTELINDPFYETYKKYYECVIDYGILKSDVYKGKETHKAAVIYFMKTLKEKYKKHENSNFYYTEDLKGELIQSKDFFELPKGIDDVPDRFDLINLTLDGHRLYWFLFLSPPYGTEYTSEDFIKINNILFPNGKEQLEIYDWNVDWSTYFDDGLEWWGAGCISIYDKTLDRFVIIFASSTD